MKHFCFSPPFSSFYILWKFFEGGGDRSDLVSFAKRRKQRMNGASPAHASSVSVATIGGGGGGGGGGGQGGSSGASAGAVALSSDDSSSFHFPTDLISAQDRKDEALHVLKSDLMAALQKEVKSLDEDNWMFAGPRSQIHHISRPGGFLHKQAETAKRWN